MYEKYFIINFYFNKVSVKGKYKIVVTNFNFFPCVRFTDREKKTVSIYFRPHSKITFMIIKYGNLKSGV